jgi:hypothetical protein
VAALIAPARILEPFGVSVGTPDGRTEVRAVYGGFGVAFGVLLLTALRVESIREGVFIAVAVALLGMAAGRLASAALGDRARLWPSWTFFATELALAALLLGAAA